MPRKNKIQFKYQLRPKKCMRCRKVTPNYRKVHDENWSPTILCYDCHDIINRPKNI